MEPEISAPGPDRPRSPPPDEIIVRADEVDVEGVDIAALSSTDDRELGDKVEARRQQDAQGSSSPRALANAVPGTIKGTARPILKREGSAPPPPPRQPPPPAPPAQQEESPQSADSLSLGQLKNLVANFPKLEPTAYAYTYEDTRSFAEELEEWFQYTEEDRGQLARAKEAFGETYYPAGLESSSETPGPWIALPTDQKRLFIQHVLGELGAHRASPLPFLDCLSYVAMGIWSETTKEEANVSPEQEKEFEPPNNKYRRTLAQLNCIKQSGELLCRAGAIEILYSLLRELLDQDQSNVGIAAADNQTRQVNSILTTLYFIVEAGREQIKQTQNSGIRDSFATLQPEFLQYLSQNVARLRWDDDYNPPFTFTKVMLLLWKSTLLIFGSSSDLETCKKAFKDESKSDKDRDEVTLTASPLDYHVFRQEITSKYPAFNPPPPLVPIEINNNTMLPPHSVSLSRAASQDNLNNMNGTNGSSRSIFNQPVHIATPAPSPPPSPAGPGGKGGKKQNYQTNQNFPFLYPPLDSTSNDLGGKGKAGEGSKLVTKKWEGGDVPYSILEAGKLFASRMRMSRPLRQLWEVREDFVEYERGWKEDDGVKALEESLRERLTKLDLEDVGDDDEEEEETAETQKPESKKTEESPEVPRKETDDESIQRRLDEVESYFRNTFPHLQSIVIVLLKVLLSNITVLGTLNAAPNGNPAPTDIEGIDTKGDELPKHNINLCKQLGSAPTSARPEESGSERSLEDINAIRTREITSKAVSAFLLLLLKWFRFSHVLKFEYMTQLLLDSNYLPLALKYFALQDVDKAVDLKHDREDLDFFRFCRLSAGLPSTPSSPTSPRRPASPSSSEDEAVPPPIARHRPDSPNESPPPSPGSPPSPPRRPEVDELGYPTSALPPTPLTNYAPRFFHTHITTLRLLQKLTKNHSHRALLLVQYKSSTILRKALKLPQPQVRLYTLKLFKTQVPFCGRKWRQANMRVITAIYVFCRMGLRDEWISGGGNVEEWVEGAVGVERAWRGLVGWWLGREYKDLITAGKDEGDELAEVDDGFFARELEKMGFGTAQEEGEWDEGGDQGPLQLEGW